MAPLGRENLSAMEVSETWSTESKAVPTRKAWEHQQATGGTIAAFHFSKLLDCPAALSLLAFIS